MKKTKSLFAILFAMAIMFTNCIPVYAAQETEVADIYNSSAERQIKAIERRMEKMQSKSTLVVVSNYDELKAAVDAKKSSIHIANDIQLEDIIRIDYDVYFSASGVVKTLFSAPEKRHILTSGESVQIQFNNVILNGNYHDDQVSTGGINASAKDTILVNPVVNNCYSSPGVGGAICNTNGGTTDLKIYGGKLYNNSAPCGGGIYTKADNVLIYDCLIENNITTRENSSQGGGLFSYYNADIYNCVFRNNTAFYGGGIYIVEGNLYLDENTIVESNDAELGGGVCISTRSIATNYSKITDNEGRMGAGVMSYGTFNMNGGEICNNISRYGAAGIGMIGDEGVVNINDGLIANNSSERFGGGIGGQSSDLSSVYINGGIIEKNQSPCGAGVYVTNVVMTDGIIQDNGYYENENGEIIVSAKRGGGIYSQNADIVGGFIYSNAAENGAGVYIYEREGNGYFSLKSPAYIRYNEASNRGGGVYLSKNVVYDMDTTRIRNNSAGVDGAQYYIVPTIES